VCGGELIQEVKVQVKVAMVTVVMQTDNSLCQGAEQVVTEHGFRAGPGLESWLHHLPAG
jgi:hypothetical protein